MADIAQFIETVYNYAGLELEEDGVVVVEEADVIKINISLAEDDSRIGIGNRGEAQYALQRIARIVFGEDYPDQKIVLNVNEYFDKRKETLVELAQNIAAEAIETGQEQLLHSHLPAHERYIIHATISEDPELSQKVRSHSEGRGRDRKIVITPLEGATPIEENDQEDQDTQDDE